MEDVHSLYEKERELRLNNQYFYQDNTRQNME